MIAAVIALDNLFGPAYCSHYMRLIYADMAVTLRITEMEIPSSEKSWKRPFQRRPAIIVCRWVRDLRLNLVLGEQPFGLP